MADHLASGLGALRGRGDGPGQHSAGGILRVDGVGLASLAAHAPVRQVDLDQPVTVPAQMECEPDAVGAGALNTEREDMAEPPCP